MTNPPLTEATPMLFTDCPLCDSPAPMDLDAGYLDCPACAVRLEVEDDPGRRTLAEAA